jgi:hypothetical protein
MVNGKPRPAIRRLIWVEPNDISRRMHRTEHARGGSVGCANSEITWPSLALRCPLHMLATSIHPMTSLSYEIVAMGGHWKARTAAPLVAAAAAFSKVGDAGAFRAGSVVSLSSRRTSPVVLAGTHAAGLFTSALDRAAARSSAISRRISVLKDAANAVRGGSRKPFHGETFRRWLTKHGCAFDELPWDTGVIALPAWRPIGKFVKAVIYLGSSWRRLDPGQFKRIVESRAGVGDGFAAGALLPLAATFGRASVRAPDFAPCARPAETASVHLIAE